MHIVSFGEVLARLSTLGADRLRQADGLALHIGGAECNVLASLRAFGASVTLVTALPDSALGDRAADELARLGLGSPHVVRSKGRLGLYFLERGAAPRPPQIVYDRAGSVFATYDWGAVDWRAVLREVDRLHVTGITLALGPRSREGLLAAVAEARAGRTEISFDVNFRRHLWANAGASADAVFPALLSECDIVFGGPDDATVCLPGESSSGSDDLARARDFGARLLDRYTRIATVVSPARRRSDSGQVQFAVIGTDRNSGTACSAWFDMPPVVDPIGSGDARVAAYLWARAQGLPLQATLDASAAAGILKYSIAGDVNLASWQEVMAVALGRDPSRVLR